jgi:hypothetical protein
MTTEALIKKLRLFEMSSRGLCWVDLTMVLGVAEGKEGEALLILSSGSTWTVRGEAELIAKEIDALFSET